MFSRQEAHGIIRPTSTSTSQPIRLKKIRALVCFVHASVGASFVPACTNSNERSRCYQRRLMTLPVSIDGYRDISQTAVTLTTREENSHDTDAFLTRDSESDQTTTTTTTTTTTQLGNVRVPLVGIGTLSWSSQSVTRLENSALQSLMDLALESNTAFLDTAERYGSNWKTALGMGWGETEALIRQLAEQNAATSQQHSAFNTGTSNCIVATKFTPSPWRTTVQSVVDACDQSRRRLGVDQIDLYQLNMPDIVQPINKIRPGTTMSKDDIYWQGLAECVHRGLAKNVGVCNYGPTLVAQCREALDRYGNVPLASNQIAYSLLGRHNGAQETVRYCNEAGIKVLAAYPLAMGLLTGKYTHHVGSGTATIEQPSSSLRASTKSFLETRDLQGYVQRMQPLNVILDEIAKDRQKTIAQVALNYIVCQGIIPIPGARTLEQFQDNMGSMGWSLNETERARLEHAADQLGFGFDGAGFKRVSEKFVGYGMEQWRLD